MIKLAVLVGGGALVFFGIQEIRVAQGTTAEPVPVKLEDLESAKATVTNPHIVIGEHYADFWDCVYHYKQSKYDRSEPGPTTKIDYLYYPIVSPEHPYVAQVDAFMKKYADSPTAPPDSEFPKLDKVAVMVKSTGIATLGDIPGEVVATPEIRGLVINKISSISKEEADLIKQGYPAFDPENVILLQAGRAPKPLIMSIAMIAGGVIVALIGLVWLAAGAKKE